MTIYLNGNIVSYPVILTSVKHLKGGGEEYYCVLFDDGTKWWTDKIDHGPYNNYDELRFYTEYMHSTVDLVQREIYISGDPQVLSKKLPGIDYEILSPCGCCDGEIELYQIIIHLNDSLHWTRERIADWLETLEIDISFKC